MLNSPRQSMKLKKSAKFAGEKLTKIKRRTKATFELVVLKSQYKMYINQIDHKSAEIREKLVSILNHQTLTIDRKNRFN